MECEALSGLGLAGLFYFLSYRVLQYSFDAGWGPFPGRRHGVLLSASASSRRAAGELATLRQRPPTTPAFLSSARGARLNAGTREMAPAGCGRACRKTGKH